MTTKHRKAPEGSKRAVFSHTPGPWEVSDTGLNIWGPKGHGLVAVLPAIKISEPTGEERANAHLIAAAPELYTSGVRLDHAIASLLSDAYSDGEDKRSIQIRHDSYCAALKEVQEAQEQWNAAIAKAKGE